MNNRLLIVALVPCALLACSKRDATVVDPPIAATPAVTAPAEPLPVPNGQIATAPLAALGESAVSGTLQFTGLEGGGVRVTGFITGLTPSTAQAIHVHEVGDCSGKDGTRAGEHFNPGNNPHGAPTDTAHHLGDMSNLRADSSGTANVDQLIAYATLHDASVNDLIGRSVIVHAQRDDYVSQPAGDSGARVACGIIM